MSKNKFGKMSSDYTTIMLTMIDDIEAKIDKSAMVKFSPQNHLRPSKKLSMKRNAS
jgi:hypothetical protein